MLTKERCKLSFEDVKKYGENNIPPLAIDIFKRLIEEHFNPQPLKFEDLKAGMWLWDSHMKKCVQVCSLNPETKIIRMESTNLANIALGVDERFFNDNRYYLIQFSKELV